MALQTSGAISISQIKTELGSSSNSLRALSDAAGKSAPDAMSEFYGYASYTPPPTVYYGSYFYGAADASGDGRAQTAYASFGPFWANQSFYPWDGAYWSYDIDSCCEVSGDRNGFPIEGGVSATIVAWSPSSHHYINGFFGVPSGRSYNWIDSSYYGTLYSLSLYDSGGDFSVGPGDIGTSLGGGGIDGYYTC
jgi:hypothetical protein